MSIKPTVPLPSDDSAVRLCPLSDADYPGLATLLNGVYQSEHSRVCLDLSAVSHLGTVEFRVLSSFAESFKRHGGFLKLANPDNHVATLIRVFGLTHLVLMDVTAPPSDQVFIRQ